MKLRLKFFWPDPRKLKDRKRLDLLTVERDIAVGAGTFTLVFNTRALLKVGAVLVVAGWVVGSGALYFWLHRNPYSQVAYADVALPWRWRGIRDARGRALIAEGLDDIKAKRLGAGVFKLKLGLNLHPQDMAARLALARLYADGGYYVGARDALLPVLDGATATRNLVEPLIRWADEADDRATIVSVCAKILAVEGAMAADRDWLRLQATRALLELRRPKEALASLDKMANSAGVEARQLRIRSLCDDGRAVEALAAADAWPQDERIPALRPHMRVLALRELGQRDEMRATLELFKSLTPTVIEARLIAIECYVRTGWDDAALAELQSCFTRFDATPGKFGQIVQTCVNVGAIELIEACIARGQSLGIATDVISAQLALTRAKKGDLDGALRAARQAREPARGRLTTVWQPLPSAATPAAGRPPSATPTFVADWVDALLDCARHGSTSGASRLVTALRSGRFALLAYGDTLEVLARAGCWSAAREVAETGLMVFPCSQKLQDWRMRVTERLAAEVQAPVAPRAVVDAPPQAAPKVVDDPIARLTAVTFMARLEAAKAANDFREQQALIDALRIAAPPWLEKVEADVAWHEVGLAVEQDLLGRAAQLTGLRLKIRKTEVNRALQIARDLAARGDKRAAKLIAEAMAGAVPEFRPGREFLAGLEPPPPKTEKPKTD